MMAEGWGFPFRSRKTHYFTEDGRSLCGGWAFYRGDLKQGNDNSPDNCTACKRKLKELRERGELGGGGEEL